MGCVTANGSTEPRKRSSNDLAIARSNIGNENQTDADLVRKKDEQK